MREGPSSGSFWRCTRAESNLESGSIPSASAFSGVLVDQPVEAQSARRLAASGLLLRSEPGEDAAGGPSRLRVVLGYAGPRTRHLLFVDEVGLAPGLARVPRAAARSCGCTLTGGVTSPARMRGMAARCSWISRLLPATCTGMKGIQFSGTVFITW